MNIITIILLLLIVLCCYHYYETQQNLIVCAIVILILLWLLIPRIEGMSNEAIQNLNSVYNKNNLITNDLNITGTFNLLPKGIIMPYTGETAPTGWALCDGKDGRPDLLNKFVRGTDLYNAGGTRTGGRETIQLETRHMPNHSHTLNLSTPIDRVMTDCSCLGRKWTNVMNSLSLSNGNEMVTTTAGKTPNDPFSIIPPYYALTYIIKL